MSAAETNNAWCPAAEPSSLAADQDNGRRLVAVRRAALRKANRYRCWTSFETPLVYAWAAYAFVTIVGFFVAGVIIISVAWTEYSDPESEVYYDDADKVDLLKGLSMAIMIVYAVAVVLAVSTCLYVSGHDRWNAEIPRLAALAREVDASIQKQDFSWPSKYEERLRGSL